MYNIGRNPFIGNGGGGYPLGGGIRIESESTSDPKFSNLQIYNNTIHKKPGLTVYYGIELNAFGSSSALNGAYIKNNIVQGFNNAWCYLGSNANIMSNIQVTHNNANGNGNSNNVQLVGGTPGVS